jgi:CubicO group peptidase (beta-lactamase class C family)
MATKTVTEVLHDAAIVLARRGSGILSNRFERFIRTQTTVRSQLERDAWDRLGDAVMDHYGERGLGVRLDTLIDKLSKKQFVAILRKAVKRRR